METIKNKKVIYFADPFFTYDVDNIEDEWKYGPEKQLAEHGIQFDKVHFYETPPFNQTNYDILFFDWGGASLGNDMLGSFCRQIIRESELYPNRCYVMISTFTNYAMEDALEVLDNKPENIFLSIKDFAQWFNKHQ